MAAGYALPMADVSLSFAGAAFRPLACGALWWPAEQTLLLADLHLEKGSHHARRGWMLPPHDSLDTLLRLAAALRRTGARRLICLGDSFHDRGGPGRMTPAARDLLAAMIAATEWMWITGNHDADSGQEIGGRAEVEWRIAGIDLRHEALRGATSPEISGHFHPKVALPLRTGRRASRRCIAITPNRMVLPAYGSFAGGMAFDDPAIRTALGGTPDAVTTLQDGRMVRIASQMAA